MRHRRRLSALALALLAAAQAACNSGELLALSYNVAGLPQGLSSSNPERNMPLIAPRLNAYDIVLVQESWKTPDPNPFAPSRVYHEILEAASQHAFRSVPKPNPFGSDPARPTAQLSDGLNRFSDFPFDEEVRIPWSSCFGVVDAGSDCLAQKGFSVARTFFGGDAGVDVYNLHGEAGSSPDDVRIRGEHMTELAAFVNEFSAGRAVIVGGDFNLHTDRAPDSEVFETLLRATGLTDVCAALDCPEPGRIDKFLFRSGTDVIVEPRSLRFELAEFASDEGEPLSDHDALAVRFTWCLRDSPAPADAAGPERCP
jgi:hypothetical protein